MFSFSFEMSALFPILFCHVPSHIPVFCFFCSIPLFSKQHLEEAKLIKKMIFRRGQDLKQDLLGEAKFKPRLFRRGQVLKQEILEEAKF